MNPFVIVVLVYLLAVVSFVAGAAWAYHREHRKPGFRSTFQVYRGRADH